jgi:hypothetical protein
MSPLLERRRQHVLLQNNKRLRCSQVPGESVYILLEEFVFNCVLFEDRRRKIFGLWFNKFVRSFKILFMRFLKVRRRELESGCVFFHNLT